MIPNSLTKFGTRCCQRILSMFLFVAVGLFGVQANATVIYPQTGTILIEKFIYPYVEPELNPDQNLAFQFDSSFDGPFSLWNGWGHFNLQVPVGWQSVSEAPTPGWRVKGIECDLSDGPSCGVVIYNSSYSPEYAPHAFDEGDDSVAIYVAPGEAVHRGGRSR